MADEIRKHIPLAPGDISLKFRDMGDGTYAPVLAISGAVGVGGIDLWYIPIDVLQPANAAVGFTQRTGAVGGTITPFRSSFGGGGGVNGQNDYAEWELALAAGTYTIDLFYLQNPDAGIITFSVEGVAVAGSIDAYASSLVPNLMNSSLTFTVAAGGVKSFRIQSTSKNASSTGFYLYVQGLSIRRTA